MERANPHSPTSTISVLAAWTAIAASGAALALLLSLHVLSPEFSPAWRMISEYANGQYSWVLSLMFVACGLGSLALAFAISTFLGDGLHMWSAVSTLPSGKAQFSRFDLPNGPLYFSFLLYLAASTLTAAIRAAARRAAAC